MIESLVVGVPKHVVHRESSEELDRFERTTGIMKTRRYAGSTLDMIKDTIKNSDRDYSHIGVIIVATQSSERTSPCLASSIQNYLGVSSETIVFDINRACDAWPFGIWLANKMADECGSILLICADRLRYGDSSPDNLIFSDAVSLTEIWYDGEDHFETFVDGSGDIELFSYPEKMYMNGSAVFDFAVTAVPKLIGKFDIQNTLIMHQANRSMNKLIAQRSGYSDKWLSSIEEYGNQSMNSIPTCIAFHEKELKEKEILCVGFGAGFSACGISLKWLPGFNSKIVEIGEP